jgi:cobalt-zinc-cadmium efflux system protein
VSHKHTLTGRPLLGATAINLVVVALQLVGGILAGSLALVGDALHNFSDVASLSLAYGATRLVGRPATATRTFGYARAEILTALVNALTLLGIGLFLLVVGGRRLLQPQPVTASVVVVLGAVGFAANTLAALVLRSHATTNLNVKAAFLHLAMDAAESAAVVLGGALMWLGVPLVDPVLSILIGLFTVKGAYDILAEASHILLQGAPAGVSADAVIRTLRSFPGVRDAHDVHVWSLTGSYVVATAHVVVADQPVSSAHEIVEGLAAALLADHGIDHPTLQLEVDRCAPASTPPFAGRTEPAAAAASRDGKH